jgi:hypothetical protein
MALMEHVNGKKPQASSLHEHTFKDSGVTVRLHKISPMTQQRLAAAIQEEMPPPAPPTIETELGLEENTADPAYEKAMKEWVQKTSLELNHRMMRLGALMAEVAIGEEEKRQIANMRRFLTSQGITFVDADGLTQDENDRVLYVLHIACASPEDLGEYGRALLRRSVPTEEAVREHIATFPRDVPREGHLPVPPDPAVGPEPRDAV